MEELYMTEIEKNENLEKQLDELREAYMSSKKSSPGEEKDLRQKLQNL